MSLRKRAWGVLLALLPLAFSGAHAVVAASAAQLTLDFDEIACAQSQVQCDVGEAYLSQGFALRYTPTLDDPSPGGLAAVGSSWRHNAKGSTAMQINSCNGKVTLMANDNSAFTPLSIDLAEMDGEGPVSIEFNAQRADGSTVRFMSKLVGKTGWRRQAFPATFKGVVSLAWSQGDCVSNRAHMFDHIALQPLTPANQADKAK